MDVGSDDYHSIWVGVHKLFEEEFKVTVILTPRSNYEISRWDTHGAFAMWILLANIIVIIGISIFHIGLRVTEEEVTTIRPAHMSAIVLPMILVGGLTTRNGRKHSKRMVREVFYGNLYRHSGVYGGDKVGG